MALHISTSGIDILPRNMENGITASGADHLCVLVHGLWGNPNHLWYLEQQLRSQYPEDKLHILVAKRNIGSFTYDGIETGGERVTKEIEDAIEELARHGTTVKKLSIVGYSLGGLISRYVVGLLYSKGWFDKLQPINFTTFATPHLGVRTPLLGFHNRLWNVLGARTLAMSGRQLFMIDTFRDTGRPLLAVLADPSSIFIRALAQFKNRSLYSNAVNDRTAVYYTTGISRIDPFVNLNEINVHYLPHYEPIILDPAKPVSRKNTSDSLPAFRQRLTSEQGFLRKIRLFIFFIFFVPIGYMLFLLNATIQSFRSRQRIKLHQEGKMGVGKEAYSFPFIVNEMRQAAEDVYEEMNTAHEHEYLPEGSEELALLDSPLSSPKHSRHNSAANANEKVGPNDDTDSEDSEETDGEEYAALLQRRETESEFPILALTPAQFQMIQALDDVGFKKYLVFIHKAQHSHAAIIVRMDRKRFEEGKVVVRHWLSEFEI